MLDTLLSSGGPGASGCDCEASSGGGKVLLLQDEPGEPGESGCDCGALLGEIGGDALLLQGGPRGVDGNCEVLTERKVEVVLLSSGGPGESGCDCEALSGESRRSVLSTGLSSCLSS